MTRFSSKKGICSFLAKKVVLSGVQIYPYLFMHIFVFIHA